MGGRSAADAAGARLRDCAADKRRQEVLRLAPVREQTALPRSSRSLQFFRFPDCHSAGSPRSINPHKWQGDGGCGCEISVARLAVAPPPKVTRAVKAADIRRRIAAVVACSQTSTRILRRRMAPFPHSLNPNRAPRGFTPKILQLAARSSDAGPGHVPRPRPRAFSAEQCNLVPQTATAHCHHILRTALL